MNPITSAEEFVALVKNEPSSAKERWRYAPADQRVWETIINEYPHMKDAVILNKTVPIAILRILAQDPDARIRYAVSMKNKIDEDTMFLLSQDPDENIRLRIAVHKKVPYSLLKIMQNDESDYVREKVARRLETEPKFES